MKTSLACTLLPVVIATFACTAKDRALNYRQDPNANELRGFSSALSSVKEPEFCSPLPSDIERYRFLWVRTFHPTVMIEVTIRESNEMYASYKATNGKGGYGHGELEEKTTRDLMVELADGDQDLIEGIIEVFREETEAEFWNLPYELDDGSIVLDGATWTIEGRRDGQCHVVTRLSPEVGNEFRRLAEKLMKLSGKRFYYDEVY